MIVLDFETRSRVNLLETGSNIYAMDGSTEILCVTMHDLEDGAHWAGILLGGKALPIEWYDRLVATDYVAAHNAAFDRDIAKYAGVEDNGFPVIPDEKWYCTAAQARVNSLPAALENAALAAKLINKKSFAGGALIKQLSIPQKDGTFNEDPKLMRDMLKYCIQDGMTTVDLVKCTRLMTDQELEDWHVNERINERGVRIDLEISALAQSYAAAEQAELSTQLIAVTGGAITKTTQTQRVRDYLLASFEPDNPDDMTVLKLMTVYKKGVEKYSLDKDIRGVILDLIEAGTITLYEDVEELIRIVDAGSMSSVSKFKRMTSRADPEDQRARGSFVYYGAVQTGRYASRGLQLHNMVRECFDSIETEEMRKLMRNKAVIKNIMRELSKLLRPALIPADGHKFVVGDWSAIEARVLPWLAGTEESDKKLDVFRRGEDVYIAEAHNMGMTDAERQIGKVAVLALGFGGAAGAFGMMAKTYGLVIDDATIARVVSKWRENNKWATKFWRQIGSAAMKAVRSKGKKSFDAGRVTYSFAPKLLGGTLVCTLPDGSAIQYPYCRIQHGEYGEYLTALKAGIKPAADSVDGEWGRVTLWHGLLAENITQAVAGRLMMAALRVCDVNMNVIAHVHDEIISEVPSDDAYDASLVLQEIMETPPSWAKGLPLNAEPVILDRYGRH
jgi:DNA polymerase